MQLESNGPGLHLLAQGFWQAGIALPHEAQVHGESISRLQHALHVPGAWGASGGKGAGGRAGATTEHGGDATGQGFFDLLWADEVNVRVDSACGDDVAFAADHLGAGADDDVNARLGVWVTAFANGHNPSALEANVGLDDAPVVDDQRVGHHGVDRTLMPRALRLRHAVANCLAAAKLGFFAIAASAQGVVLLHLDDQVRVSQAHTVTHRGAVHLGVGAFVDGCHV